MPFPILPSNSATGYFLTKSLRFRSSATAYLNRTPSTAGNKKTWTYSAWVKRGALGTSQSIFYATPDGTTVAWNGTNLWFDSSNQLRLQQANSPNTYYVTSAVFRDPSAWYHIVCAVDTTQATAGNRVLIYVNNVLQTLTIPLGSGYAQNDNTWVNGTYEHDISSQNDSPRALYLDGYLAEINFVDGLQLTPSSFGSTNSLTGVWQPAKYTGTYGTNGFYLPFTNTTSTTTLGYDFSGNSNNWTTNNISLTAGTTYDSMTDVPTLTSTTTANTCTLNPLEWSQTNITFSNANLTLSSSSNAGYNNCGGTFVPANLKGYLEVTCTNSPNGHLGVSNSPPNQNNYQAVGTIYLETNGDAKNAYFNTLVSGCTPSFNSGDVMMMAWDFTGGTQNIWFGRNGTWGNNAGGSVGVPSTGANPTVTNATLSAYGPYRFYVALNNGAACAINFGQQPYAYSAPTGFLPANSYNLPTSTIVKGNTVMNALTWSGTGTSSGRSFTGLGFKPDLVWGKPRSLAYSHSLSDSVRGVNKRLQSQTTTEEQTNFTYGYTSSFDSDGFTTTAGSTDNENWNQTSETFVAWCWQAGQGTNTTNTTGSITSTVSVNASAGFSVVTYTGNSTNPSTVGHGLGVAPQFIIIKCRSNAYNWVVGSKAIDGFSSGKQLYLNSTSAVAGGENFFSNTQPTSTVFTVKDNYEVNFSGYTYVAYCWTPIAGFSSFGSYTGNGSSDGPFVYTGFRPKFVMIKSSSDAGGWSIFDSVRDSYNQMNKDLEANSADAEYTPGYLKDFVSNGFKIREANLGENGNGRTYIYMAFAENPFKNALAR